MLSTSYRPDGSTGHEALREAYLGDHGFPGYKINEWGHVWSCRRVTGHGGPRLWKPLRFYMNQNGYYEVTLFRNKKPVIFRVRNLVAICFIGPRPEGTRLCSLDEDEGHHVALNLKYMTEAEEIAAFPHRRKGGLPGELSYTAKLTGEQVRTIRKRLAAGDDFMDVVNSSGVSERNVMHIAQRKTWFNRDHDIPAMTPRRTRRKKYLLTAADLAVIRDELAAGRALYQVAKDRRHKVSVYTIRLHLGLVKLRGVTLVPGGKKDGVPKAEAAPEVPRGPALPGPADRGPVPAS